MVLDVLVDVFRLGANDLADLRGNVRVGERGSPSILIHLAGMVVTQHENGCGLCIVATGSAGKFMSV